MSNILILSDKGVELCGFDTLTNALTFCFYPSGIVICPYKPEIKPFYYPVHIKQDHTILDPDLVKMLRDRHLSDKSSFFYDEITGSYFEDVPHRLD